MIPVGDSNDKLHTMQLIWIIVAMERDLTYDFYKINCIILTVIRLKIDQQRVRVCDAIKT